MAPPAPARFSTTTGCPSEASISLAASRPSRSPVPPAGKGTMSLTGRVGQVCANNALGAAAARASSARATPRWMRIAISSQRRRGEQYNKGPSGSSTPCASRRARPLQSPRPFPSPSLRSSAMRARDFDLLDAYSEAVTQVAERVGPSVAAVQLHDRHGKPAGSGSGFLFTQDGYLLTNSHVVGGGGSRRRGAAAACRGSFGDGRHYRARWVGEGPHTGLAVLRVGA